MKQYPIKWIALRVELKKEERDTLETEIPREKIVGKSSRNCDQSKENMRTTRTR